MQNSKLLAFFRALNPKELRSLGEFVKSPFFNKREDVLLLYDYLKKQATHNFPSKKLTKEVVAANIFQEDEFSDKRIKYTMTELSRVMDRFIAITHFEEDGILKHYYRMNFFLEHKLDKHFRQAMKIARSEFKPTSFTADYLYQEYLLSTLDERISQQQGVRSYDPTLQQAANRLDDFYFFKKIRYLCLMLEREVVFPSNYEKFLIDEIEGLLEAGTFPLNDLTDIYRALFLLLRTENAKFFVEFKEKLFLHYHLFEHDEVQLLFYFGINYCIRQIRKKDQEQYTKDLMDFYTNGVEGGYLLSNNEISPWTFKNMVQLGIGLKRYSWLETFIEKYHQLLPEREVDGAFHYNMAQVYYSKGDFIKAYQHLNLSEFNNINYNIGGKILLLRMYWEEGELDALFSLLASFEIYLKRTKLLTGEAKIQYLNFGKVLFQIAKYGIARKETIQKKMNDYKVIAARRWLQKMIDQL